jgi:D-alanyl-D-alanine carboxypeptidase
MGILFTCFVFSFAWKVFVKTGNLLAIKRATAKKVLPRMREILYTISTLKSYPDMYNGFTSEERRMEEDTLNPTSTTSDTDISWIPRPQSPAQSYTSLRRYRQEIAIDRLACSNELPPIPRSRKQQKRSPEDSSTPPPSTNEAPRTSRPLVEDTRKTPRVPRQSGKISQENTSATSEKDEVLYPPLPRPGMPLFGQNGLVNRPPTPSDLGDYGYEEGIDPLFPDALAARKTPPVTQPQAAISPSSSSGSRKPFVIPGSRTITGMQPVIRLPETTVAVAEPEEGESSPKTREKRSRFSLGWKRRKPHASSETGTNEEDQSRRRTFAVNRSIISIAGILVILIIVARPLFSSVAAPLTKTVLSTSSTGLSATASLIPIPAAPAKTYTPVSIDTDHSPPVLWAESAYLMDQTNGAAIYAKNPFERLPMASTTKLMTAIVAVEHAPMEKVITITKDAEKVDGTKIPVKNGEKYTLQELLIAMFMISGNDSAYAIGVGVAGDEKTFVNWMNDKAKLLGLDNTHFTNPHGLDDDNHYSCAHDLAVIGRTAMSNQQLQAIMNTRSITIPATATHPKRYFDNQHQSLWWYPGADGGKPGWTGAARFVDVLSAERNGHHLIGVVMHSQNDWVTDIRALMNYGFNDYTWFDLHALSQKENIPFASAYSYFTWDVPSRSIQVGDRRFYNYTGFTVSDAFLTYFDKAGGLNGFGFPKSIPKPTSSGELIQSFEKASITCNPNTGVCRTT